MSDRVLRIRIRPIGQESVTRAVRGITQSAQQAQRAQERAALGAQRVRARAEQQATREAQRGAAARERAAQNEARDASRLAAQTARAREQSIRQVARAEQQANQQAQREANELYRLHIRLAQQRQRAAQQQQQRRTGREAAIFGGAAAGAAAMSSAALLGAFEAITSRIESITAAVGGRAGVMTEAERTARGQDFELNLARSSGEFFQGVSPEERATQMGQLADEINRVALASGQSPTELLDVLTTMQSRFSQFDQGRQSLQAIADEAQRTGGDMQTLATFVGTVNQQLGDAAPSAQRLFDIMAEMGLQGSVTPESFAEHYAPLLGQFQASSGLTGEQSVRELGALANVISPIAGSDSEAATQISSLMSAMGDQETRARIAAATGGTRHGHGRSATYEGGLQYTNEDGSIDYLRLIEGLSQVHGVGSTNAIFGNVNARRAISSLTRAELGITNGPSAADLVNVDASAATTRRAEDLARVHNTSAFESRMQGVQTEINGYTGRKDRVALAREQLDFGEAVTQTQSTPLMGAIGAITPDIVSRAVVPQLAEMISGLSPETRGNVQGILTQGKRAALGMGGMGIPVAGALGGAGQLFGELGVIGDRQRGLATERRVALAADTRVHLSSETVSAIGRSVAEAIPRPSPGGSSGGASRVPSDQR